MEYKNLDKALAFQDLMKLQRASLKNNLTPRRIREYCATAGSGVTYNYAAMPVNSEIVAKLQELCDEMELVEKYVALLSGEMMNPGEKRLVQLHRKHRHRGRRGQGGVLCRPAGEDQGLQRQGQERQNQGLHRQEVRHGLPDRHRRIGPRSQGPVSGAQGLGGR